MSLPLPLVAVSGTPSECGVAYGKAAAELVAGNTANYMARFARDAGLEPERARAAGAAFRAMTAERLPRIAAMLDGVAAGAGVPVDELYALNARTELLYGVTSATECTSIGVLDERSEAGQVLLAQNWDWHPDQRPYTVLLATRDERGFEVVALTEAGMLAKTGLNGAGLGVCVNLLTTDRDGRPGGVPYHVLLRAVLETSTLHEALVAVCGNPRSASINLLIGQAFGHGIPGELIDVEAVPGDAGFLHPVDGVITHANHLETALSAHDTLKDFGSSSFFRSARARRLLGDGPLGEKELIDVLTDHGGYPRAICRHDDGSPIEADRSETIFSVVLNLDERRLSVAAGPPCGADAYVPVELPIRAAHGA
jgi:isopenicillin-N N-acyltransferase like protein